MRLVLAASRAADWELYVDDAVAVLQQRDREQYRELGGGRAFDLLAEGELVG